MRNNGKKPEPGERKVTLRELVESELDLIVGGGNQPPAKPADKTKKPAAPS